MTAYDSLIIHLLVVIHIETNAEHVVIPILVIITTLRMQQQRGAESASNGD